MAYCAMGEVDIVLILPDRVRIIKKYRLYLQVKISMLGSAYPFRGCCYYIYSYCFILFVTSSYLLIVTSLVVTSLVC